MKMESMSVNDILRVEIDKIDHTLIPTGFRGDAKTVREMQAILSRIIDEIGKQSAQAQQLNKVITTAEKLRNQPSHVLYILKDFTASNGRGEVIGFLRVGHKKLYLYDEKEGSHEVSPLCVLDLFVRPHLQRKGYGKKLFDHMLQDQCVTVTRLAIDGPSEKMVSFLKRNYNVSLRRQPNNFAVAPEFFEQSQRTVNSGRTTPSSSGPVGRYSAPKPHSTIASESPASFGRFAARQPLSSMAAIIHGNGGHHNQTSVAAPSEANHTTVEDEEVEVEVDLPVAETPAEGHEDGGGSPRPERPSSLHIDTESQAVSPTPPVSPCAPTHAAGTSTARRGSQVTDKGYFNIKFYHNKLW